MPTTPISIIEADRFARQLTNDQVFIEVEADAKRDGSVARLCRAGSSTTVGLLPYQLTRAGIEEAIAENDPWPEA